MFTVAEAITRLPDRVFTIDGTKNLRRKHFDNLCKRARVRINQENWEELALHKRRRQLDQEAGPSLCPPTSSPRVPVLTPPLAANLRSFFSWSFWRCCFSCIHTSSEKGGGTRDDLALLFLFLQDRRKAADDPPRLFFWVVGLRIGP